MEQVNKEAYGQIRKWTRYTNQFHFLLLLRKHMEDKTMCEAGYDLKLLLKNEENIITETKWGKSEADRCPYAKEECKTLKPSYKEKNGHKIFCHFSKYPEAEEINND